MYIYTHTSEGKEQRKNTLVEKKGGGIECVYIYIYVLAHEVTKKKPKPKPEP